MTAPTTGWITFVQNRLPALLAGEYTVEVDLHLENTDPRAQDPGDQAYLNHTFRQTSEFAVSGPRFLLRPDAFHSVFPPNNSQGEYRDVLPHVVLTNPTMPWQRSADGRDGTPWLAVLVLHADDGVPAAVVAKVGDLRHEPFTPDPTKDMTRPSTLPDATATYPKLVLDYGESWSQNCRVIDVPVDVFSAVVPALVDLPWLAHDRTITPTEPLDSEGETSSSSGPAYPVVVSNRLPKDDECTAHLVSLENMSKSLPTVDADGMYHPAEIKVSGGPNDGKLATAVRLVTLKTWTFRPIEPTETFDGYLEHIDASSLRRPAFDPGDTAADQAVANAFDMGYTAVDHHTRLGDNTVSWLRGPFVPYDVGEQSLIPIPDPATGALPVSSSDAAARYDPTTGMLDETYAVAWQIGRLLALQNTSFAIALYDWKRTHASKTVLALEREYLQGQFADPLPTIGEPHDNLDLLGEVMELFASHVAPALKVDGASVEASNTGGIRQRGSLHQRYRDLLGNVAALQAIHTDAEPPAAVIDWLNRIRKFHGVPFNNLVPDEAMLPTESIRFFRVDNTWVYALLEGALSLGSSTQGDAAHNAVLHPLARAAVAPPPAASGLFLRSGAVAGWPEMHVNAYDADNEPLHPIRIEALSRTVLLALFEGTINTINLMEPPIGLHFGIQVTGSQKELRWVTIPTVAVDPQPPPNAQPGDQIVGTSAGPVDMRTDGYTVAIDARATAIESALNAAHGNLEPGTTTARPFTTAEFALQLVEGVQEFRFVRDVPGAKALTP